MLSSFAFKFNLRRYAEAEHASMRAAAQIADYRDAAEAEVSRLTALLLKAEEDNESARLSEDEAAAATSSSLAAWEEEVINLRAALAQAQEAHVSQAGPSTRPVS